MRKLNLFKTRKRKIWFVLLALLILATASGYLVIKTLNSPAQGIILSPMPQDTPDTSTAGNQKLDTEFFQTAYPGRYEKLPSPTKGTSASLGAWILLARQLRTSDVGK